MKKNVLFALWGILFILCAGLGFIPEPEGGLRVLMTLLSVLFFLPPFGLLAMAKSEKDAGVPRLIAMLSGASLGLTLALLVCSFLSAFASETLGVVLHYVLTVVSSPMICSGYWALSLFLWAFLLIMAGKKKK